MKWDREQQQKKTLVIQKAEDRGDSHDIITSTLIIMLCLSILDENKELNSKSSLPKKYID